MLNIYVCVLERLPLQDDVLPFPWSQPSGASTGAQVTTNHDKKMLPEQILKVAGPGPDPCIKSIQCHRHRSDYVQAHLESSQLLLKLYEQCLQLGCITLNLPPLGALAGRVLQHASRALEKLFSKWEPMIWKVGYTHDPVWRWSNSLYGYARAADKWEAMEILYVSPEPCSPAMLEAALIDKFKGFLASLYVFNPW